MTRTLELFVSDDWIIVNADGTIVEKERFLAVVKSGTLTHNAMTLDEPRVKIYTGVVTGRATSAGKFMRAEFTTLERATDVFVKTDGQWRCLLTQLTKNCRGQDSLNGFYSILICHAARRN
jgi:Domain of unknown function (DUF4440)